MLFQKETKIREMINQSQLLQNRMDTEFAPVSMDMPYRIIVMNNLTKVIDAAGGVTTYTYIPTGNTNGNSLSSITDASPWCPWCHPWCQVYTFYKNNLWCYNVSSS